MSSGQMVTAWLMMLAVFLGLLGGIQAGVRVRAARRTERAIGPAAGERASAARCAHAGAVPVDLQLTGERVAWWCPDCSTQLAGDFDPAAPPEPEPERPARRPRREPGPEMKVLNEQQQQEVLNEQQQAKWDLLNEQLLVLDGRIAALLRVADSAGSVENSELMTRMREQRLRLWNELNAMVQEL